MDNIFDEKKSFNNQIASFIHYEPLHPILENVINKIINFVNGPKGYTVALVTGPAGVGKTTALKIIAKNITSQFADFTEGNIRLIPALILKLNSIFSWRVFFLEALQTIDEQLEVILKHNKKPILVLRKSFEDMIKAINLRVLLIDDAQQIDYSLLSYIITLSKAMEIKVVLFGTNELGNYLDNHINSNPVSIHFQCYENSALGFEGFKKVVLDFQRNIPLDKEPDLISNWEYLYSKTYGSVGDLKSLLIECIYFVIKNGFDTIDMHILDKCATSLVDLNSRRFNNPINSYIFD